MRVQKVGGFEAGTSAWARFYRLNPGGVREKSDICRAYGTESLKRTPANRMPKSPRSTTRSMSSMRRRAVSFFNSWRIVDRSVVIYIRKYSDGALCQNTKPQIAKIRAWRKISNDRINQPVRAKRTRDAFLMGDSVTRQRAIWFFAINADGRLSANTKAMATYWVYVTRKNQVPSAIIII